MKYYHIILATLLLMITACKEDDMAIINNHYISNTDSSYENNITYIVDTVYRELHIIDSNYYNNEQSIPFYNNSHNKLWSHRVNDVEEIMPTLENFPGVELDVFFEGDHFDVRHDGTPTGLTLKTYFSSIKNPYFYYYWLDFKNLNTNNAADSYQLLSDLLIEFNIMDNVIIESFDTQALGYYSERNIHTSFWVYVENPYSSSNNKVASKVTHYMNKYKYSALSANYIAYPFFKKYFPTTNLHLWVKSSDVSGDDEAKQIVKDLVKDPFVKVILVTTKENFIIEDSY